MFSQMVYVCERCGRRANNESEILECERQHNEIDAIWKCKEFIITSNHLKLLQRQNVKYNHYTEYGATEIDPKRPYGNSWVEGDIAEIFEIEPEGKDDGEPCFTDEQNCAMWKIHVETAIALKICLELMKFETGTYRREPDWIVGGWKKVE